MKHVFVKTLIMMFSFGLVLLLSHGSFAGIELGDTIISTGDYPVVVSGQVRGGFHTVSTLTAMYEIPLARLEEGMSVWVIDADSAADGKQGKMFRLNKPVDEVIDPDPADSEVTGSTDWSEVAEGSGAIDLADHNVTELMDVTDAGSGAIITAAERTRLNAAYGWGDHAGAGYLSSYSETDPIFTDSAAFGITSGEISNWNTAYGWGNHALAGYLTSYTESDPTVDLTKLQTLVSNDFHNLGGTDLTLTSTEIAAMGFLNEGSLPAAETDPTVDLAKLQSLVINDFHNLGGVDADTQLTKEQIAEMGFVDFSDEDADISVPFPNGTTAITRQGLPVTDENMEADTVVSFLNAVFFPAKPPEASLSIQGLTTREYGEDTALTLNWTATKQDNDITSTTLEVSSGTGTVGSLPAPDGGTQSGSVAAESSGNIAQVQNSTTFKLTVSDGETSPATATATMYWKHKRYWGVTNKSADEWALTDYDNFSGSDDYKLSGSGEFSTAKSKMEISLSPENEYIFYLYPKSFGALGSGIALTGDFGYIAISPKTITFMNWSDGETEYYLYVTPNAYNSSFSNICIK